MQTIGGIFDSAGQAMRAVRALQKAGVRDDELVVLMPGSDPKEFEIESEMLHDQAGPGAWGAVGAGIGSFAGAAFVSAILPGIGPILGLGALAAAFIAGGIGGKLAGDAIESSHVHDDVGDDFHLFEHYLRRNKAIVIAMIGKHSDPQSVDAILRASGVKSLDEARAEWWRTWREQEESHYATLGSGRPFAEAESAYRRGFQAGFDPRWRGRKFESVAVKLRPLFRDWEEEDFRHGFDRAQELDWEMQQDESIEEQRAARRSRASLPSAPTERVSSHSIH